MPRCFDDPFPVYLDSDADKPESKRPTFYFRTLSLREWRVLEKADGDNIDKAQALLSASIENWTNIVNRKGDPIPYASGELDGVVNPAEMLELCKKLELGYADKKKLESQPSCSAEGSAEPAA